MSVGNLTATADIGPGRTVTALSLPNIRSLKYDFPDDRVEVILADGTVKNFDYSTLATITHVISAGVATITLAK